MINRGIQFPSVQIDQTSTLQSFTKFPGQYETNVSQLTTQYLCFKENQCSYDLIKTVHKKPTQNIKP